VHALVLIAVNLDMTFEMPSFTSSNYMMGPKIKRHSRRLFMGRLSSQSNWYCLPSTHVQKSSAIPQNCRF